MTSKPDAALDAMRPVLPAELMDRASTFDPAPRLARLSEAGPIHRIEHHDEPLWLVTSQDAARRLLSGLAPTSDLSDDEMVGPANLLLIAGHETTTNMLGLGVLALLDHPEQLGELREDPDGLMETAVEEMLRYLSIVDTGIVRYALEDVRIGDVTIYEATR
ncbi:hypothetical protein GCM10022267_30850 [Lentzea roselyniae]|uniref:Cytochrome P450 n=1 Tax=Lentzea roselyniae TaxID=531940 RepID=A0ABP7AX99_9PSEU